MDDFDAIINQAKRIVGTSRAIASDVYPNGATLRCLGCGKTESASKEQVARYFSTGWPKHCHATMGAERI